MIKVTSSLEADLLLQIKKAGMPLPKCQYKYHPSRKVAADFAYPSHKLLIEIEGVAPNRASFFRYHHDSCVKQADALILGWQTIRLDSQMIRDKSGLIYIATYLNFQLDLEIFAR